MRFQNSKQNHMELEQVNNYLDQITQMIIDYAPKLALALIVVIVGLKVINKLSDLAAKAMARAGISENILPFLHSILSVSMKVMLLFSVAGIIGIETSSFIAVLAAAGFAVGLALQGSLSNLAAGIIVLVFRPYKVGDWIEVQEKFGKVEEIQIFNTIIVTPGMKTLIIPNGQIVEGIVTNYSKKGCIRLELNVTMPYEESYPKVEKVLMDVLTSTPKVLESPRPEVGIESYDSHNIILGVRPYVNPDDFWEVTFEVHRRIKAAFSEHNVKVAYSEGVEIGNIGN